MPPWEARQLFYDTVLCRLEKLGFFVDKDEQATISEEVYERVHVVRFVSDENVHGYTLLLCHIAERVLVENLIGGVVVGRVVSTFASKASRSNKDGPC